MITTTTATIVFAICYTVSIWINIKTSPVWEMAKDVVGKTGVTFAIVLSGSFQYLIFIQWLEWYMFTIICSICGVAIQLFLNGEYFTETRTTL